MIAIMIDAILGAVSNTRSASYRVGDAIFHQGAPSGAIFQVRRGCVEVVRHLADGSKVTIATAREGETFAEAALFAERYHCDALARTDCEVVSIPTASVRDLLDREPAMARNLAAFFAGQVRELRTRVEILRIKRAPDRLLAWLRAAAKGEPPTVEQSSPWASVANEIGLTPEVVYRSLRKLEQTGQIERSGAVVIIRAAN